MVFFKIHWKLQKDHFKRMVKSNTGNSVSVIGLLQVPVNFMKYHNEFDAKISIWQYEELAEIMNWLFWKVYIT